MIFLSIKFVVITILILFLIGGEIFTVLLFGWLIGRWIIRSIHDRLFPNEVREDVCFCCSGIIDLDDC